MSQQFFEMLDTNDTVFFSVVAMLVVIIIVIEFCDWLKKLNNIDNNTKHRCSRCNGSVNYLTIGDICQECAWREVVSL